MMAKINEIGAAAGLFSPQAIQSIWSNPTAAQTAVKILSWLIEDIEGLSEISIATGPITGLRMEVELKRQKYFWMGTYEPWTQDAILKHWRPDMHLWDIGAFIGFHTLVMRKVAGPGRVLAIEPDPANRQRLRRNLTLNGFEDIRVLSSAIGAKRGMAELKLVPDGPSQTTILDADNGSCEVVTMDDLLQSHAPPGLVKLDIEGGEAKALHGSQALLRKVRPIWLIETHGESGQDALEQLRFANYQVTRIDHWHNEAAELIGGGAEHHIAIP